MQARLTPAPPHLLFPFRLRTLPLLLPFPFQVENTASLKLLLAMEAESKRRATIVKKQYTGPIVKFHSVRCGDQERVRARGTRSG